MNRFTTICFFATCTLIGGAGCGRSGLNVKEIAGHSSLSKMISGDSSLTLYEGLPHQKFEASLLEKELATKKTLLLHQFPFYDQPLPVTDEDDEKLRVLAADIGSFTSHPVHTAKACGGFHPDYGLVWKNGITAYEMLICFGCQEAKIYGPQQELLVDIRRDAFSQFERTLKKYKNQRPQLD